MGFRYGYTQGIAIGTRIDLTGALQLSSATGQFAQLFVPDYYIPPTNGKIKVVFHLHSASWAAEDQVYKSETNAVLFNIHLGGFSSSYQVYFSDTSKFQQCLDTILTRLSFNNIISNPTLEKLTITSFSAGYAGLREVLKTPVYYQLVDAVLLADGLHSSSNPSTMKIQMTDFLGFAKDAAERKKVMILTHSSIVTYGYQNTTQTAQYLVDSMAGQFISFINTDAIGSQYRRFDMGLVFIRGYNGMTATDHLNHLYAMDLSLKQIDTILDTLTTDECVPPQILFSNHVGPTSAILNWTMVDDALGYIIKGKRKAGTNWKTVQITGGLTSQKSVAGLKNNTTYVWNIQALCDTNSTLSEVSIFDTFSTGCQAPDSIWAEVLSPTTVQLNWTDCAEAAHYYIKTRKFGNATINVTQVPANNTSHILWGLLPNIQYEWTLQTICDQQNGWKSLHAPISSFNTSSNKMMPVETAVYVSKPEIYYSQTMSEIIIHLLSPEKYREVKIFTTSGHLLTTQQTLGCSQVKVLKDKLSVGICIFNIVGEQTPVIQKIVIPR